MATKITGDVIESYLNCKYKSHLQLAGQQGARSDYALLLTEARDEVRRRATDTILARHPAGEVERDLVLTPAALKRGAAFLLNATLEDEHLALAFDGLQRVPGPSRLGDFHYVPVLFAEGRQVRRQQRALVDVYGLVISRLQGRAPGHGIIWHGKECRATRVRLSPDARKAERVLEELRQLQTAAGPPRLVLNDHCAACEFRQRCHQQAVQEDNLSLLRGMKEKVVKACAQGHPDRHPAGAYLPPPAQGQAGTAPQRPAFPRAASPCRAGQEGLRVRYAAAPGQPRAHLPRRRGGP